MNPAPSGSRNESFLVTLRSFPRPVWVLFVGVFLNKFGTFVVPFLTLYLTRQGFTTGDAGLAIGAYGVGRLGAAFLGGHLADTLGRRRTIVLSMISVAVTMLLLSQARTLPAIIFLTGLASLTGELYVPAGTALLADLVPEHRRVTAYAAYRMAFNAGWAFGPAAAAFLASHSFLWLFVGDALSSALFGIVALLLLPPMARGKQTEAGWREAWTVIRSDARIHQVAVATVCIGFVFHQLVSSYGLHVTSLGFSDAVYGTLLSLNGVLVVVCELPITGWTRHFPPRAMMAAGYVLMGAGFVWNIAAGSVATLAIGMAVFTLGEMVYAPVASAYVASLAPPRMRGRYMGTWALANALSLMVAPSLGMAMFARHPMALWLGCGGMAVLAALAITMRISPAPAAARPRVLG